MSKLTATLVYWDRTMDTIVTDDGFRYEDPDSYPLHEETIEGDSEIKLFEEFYKLNNKLRYCNGSFYKWKDPEMEDEYYEWVKSEDYKRKSFNLYYGNGVVD